MIDIGLDTEMMFEDFGDKATWVPSAGGPAKPGLVILDEPDALFFNDMLHSPDPVIHYPASQWAGLDEGEVLMVEVCRSIRRYRLTKPPEAIDDGAVMKASVRKL
ncbi:MAG: hypothetical protein ACK4FF_05470 [Limnobacter sp.]|uniref:head-tail joining protein n=1 Tax=Limnobacter sp. TaxID=2003368 RepID=UPI00391B1FD5